MPRERDASSETVPDTFSRRRVLVIGYGNPLRGDDALGPLVAEQLRQTLPADWTAGGAVEILTCHCLTPELAIDLGQATLAVFVDAAVTGPSGEVVCRRIGPCPATATGPVHGATAENLLALATHVAGHAPEAYLISVRGESFDLADSQLSAQAAAAVPRLLQQVRHLIAEHLAQATTPRDRPGAG